MVLPWLIWCLWRERNYQYFEDCERMLGELKDFFFKILYLWTTAFDANISSFDVFLELFSSSSQVFLLYSSCVLELRFLINCASIAIATLFSH
jgi:hypothetical protein